MSFDVISRESAFFRVQCHERRDVARCHLKMSLETRGGSPQVQARQFNNVDDNNNDDGEDGAYGVGIPRKTKEP